MTMPATIAPSDPETKGEPASETQADDDENDAGTDDGGEQQTESSQDADGDDDDSGSDDDEDRVAAAVEAQKAAWIEEGKRLKADEDRAAAKTQQHESLRSEAKTLFPKALQDARAAATKLNIAEDQLTEILKPIEAYNLHSLQANEQIVLDQLVDQFYAKLPDSLHDTFSKAVDGKPLADWLEAYLETAALDTAAVKDFHRNLTLEQAQELSPKLKAEVATLKANEFESGRKKGRKDPGGEPAIDGGGAASMKWEDLSRGYGGGTLTPAQEREYHRQKAERQKAS